MSLQVATALADGPADQAASAIVASLRERLGDAAPALVCVFASTKQPLEQVLSIMSAAFPTACIVGASTAGEFTEVKDAKGAVSAFAVAGDVVAHGGIGTGLAAGPEAAVSAALSSLPTAEASFPSVTAIMLLDPLTGRGEEAALIAATLLGDGVPLAGGAAGDDLAMKTTHVGLGTRVAADAVVLVKLFTKSPLGVGVCHGHEPLSETLTVTKASGAVVYEINDRPAWEVWAEHTEAAAGKRGVDPAKLSDEEIGGFLLRYEAGLAAGSDFKIRAPLARGEDGSLSFACGIPQGAEIRITESEPDRQIDSARMAAERARESLGGGKVAGALVFDCICRNLILGERFQDAVNEVSKALGDVPLAGFETYGEIALSAGDMSGFHNTTTVVLAFPE
jgi:methyl-accepting chemotaxis protein